MKVLHIDTESNWRGGQNQLKLLIEGLDKSNIISFLVSKKGSAIEEKADLFCTDHKFFFAIFGEFDLIAARKISKLIDRFEIPLVHAHSSHAHSIAFLAKILSRKKPRVIVTRRVFFHPFRKGTFKPLVKLKYLWGADHYIAISRKVKEVLVSCGIPEGKVSVVYSGTDPERVVGGRRDYLKSLYDFRGVAIGNISYFDERKGHDDLIEAFRIVRGRGFGVKLFLAGCGEREGFIRGLVRRLGLEGDVVFLGYREDVRDLFASFDLFVISSREEGLCSSIIDAFFAGCPVVATDAGGIPELVQDGVTGVLARRSDPQSLAEAMIYAIKHPDRMEEMARCAKEMAYRGFTADAMVNGNIKVYQKVLGMG